MEWHLKSADLSDIRVVFTVIPYHNVRTVLPPLELFKKIYQLSLGAARRQLANKIEEMTGCGKWCRRLPLLAMPCHVYPHHGKGQQYTDLLPRVPYGVRVIRRNEDRDATARRHIKSRTQMQCSMDDNVCIDNTTSRRETAMLLRR
jgi:hypothetical protein